MWPNRRCKLPREDNRINDANLLILSHSIRGLSCLVCEIWPRDGQRTDRQTNVGNQRILALIWRSSNNWSHTAISYVHLSLQIATLARFIHVWSS